MSPEAEASDRFVRRRVGIIWYLLFFNALGFIGPTLLPIPKPVAQLFTMGALVLALVLAICLNPRLEIRPNLVLALMSVLAVTATMTSVRGLAGPGAVVRSGRLLCVLAVLWLLTPWWGRRDLLLARCHLRAVIAVSCLVLLGLAVSPGLALSGAGQGRLIGIIWPIPQTQVAEYAALATGMSILLWLSGAMGRRSALLVAAAGIGMLLASQTRTALLALTAGLFIAGLTSFLSQRRFRRAAMASVLLLPLFLVLLGPALFAWFTRDQTAEQLAGLTGRKNVWAQLVNAPRSEFNQWFGFGLSDKSFEGFLIDSTWMAAYQDEGLVGVGVVAAIFVFLLIVPAFRPPGPARALATFLVVFCAVSSYTEVGLGDASNYLLAIVAAASLVTARPEPAAVAGTALERRGGGSKQPFRVGSEHDGLGQPFGAGHVDGRRPAPSP